jgi:hypothetical protein
MLLKTELRSVERVTDRKRIEVSKFSVRLIVVPGYGQPGALPTESVDVASITEKTQRTP